MDEPKFNPYPNGPVRQHPRRSLLSIHKQIARRQKAEAARRRWWRGARPPVVLNHYTRDELRVLAKERGLTGYGKMNKAQLVAVLS